jgi:hypothetical protein
MSVPLLNANAAPIGAAFWLQMLPEWCPTHNPRMPSGRLHGSVTIIRRSPPASVEGCSKHKHSKQEETKDDLRWVRCTQAVFEDGRL